MVIIFVGPPGSGKGTQAKKLADELGYLYLSTGQMLRNLKNSRPDIAKIIDSGDLLPDEQVLSLIFEYLEEKGAFDKLIIDGTPRTVGQYEGLKKWFKGKGTKIKWSVFLNISKQEAVKRLSARRQDKETGKIYNLITNTPGPEVDPDKLITREDDKSEVIEERFEEYFKQTKPLIEHLKKEGILIELDGEKSIDTIFEDMVEELSIKNE